MNVPKYFNVLNMVFVIVLTPFWSAFTDAYVKKDYNWMSGIVKKLEFLWLLCIPILILMVLCSNFFYQWWVGNSVSISFSLSICMAVFMFFYTSANLYMILINGTSMVCLQLIINVCFAIISLPCICLFCRLWGVQGALLIPTVTLAVLTLIGKIQIMKIVNNRATGIWQR